VLCALAVFANADSMTVAATSVVVGALVLCQVMQIIGYMHLERQRMLWWTIAAMALVGTLAARTTWFDLNPVSGTSIAEPVVIHRFFGRLSFLFTLGVGVTLLGFMAFRASTRAAREDGRSSPPAPDSAIPRQSHLRNLVAVSMAAAALGVGLALAEASFAISRHWAVGGMGSVLLFGTLILARSTGRPASEMAPMLCVVVVSLLSCWLLFEPPLSPLFGPAGEIGSVLSAHLQSRLFSVAAGLFNGAVLALLTFKIRSLSRGEAVTPPLLLCLAGFTVLTVATLQMAGGTAASSPHGSLALWPSLVLDLGAPMWLLGFHSALTVAVGIGCLEGMSSNEVSRSGLPREGSRRSAWSTSPTE
jgi:hypothetical protein